MDDLTCALLAGPAFNGARGLPETSNDVPTEMLRRDSLGDHLLPLISSVQFRAWKMIKARSYLRRFCAPLITRPGRAPVACPWQ